MKLTNRKASWYPDGTGPWSYDALLEFEGEDYAEVELRRPDGTVIERHLITWQMCGPRAMSQRDDLSWHLVAP